MQTTDRFTVNGKPLLLPDAGVTCSFEDLDSYAAGRDQSGVMHRDVVRYKVGSWTFSYGFLTEAEKQYMEGLFPKAATFTFGYPEPVDAEKTRTCTAYRSRYSLSWYDAARGVWKNYGFSIIEC